MPFRRKWPWVILFLLLSAAVYVTCTHVTPRPPAGVAGVNPLLAGIVVVEIPPEGRAGYDRQAWKHWVDADHDCQNTREEVLIRDAESIDFADPKHCRIAGGRWHDPYTGEEIASPGALDIDHVVPLHNAYQSGGYAWDAETRERYANDLEHPHHLRAVSAHANRDKGDKSPEAWMPPAAAFACEYLSEWAGIKRQWKLTMTPAEFAFINTRLTTCGQQRN